MIIPEHIWKEMVAFCEAGKTGRIELLVNQGHIASGNLVNHLKGTQMDEIVTIDIYAAGEGAHQI